MTSVLNVALSGLRAASERISNSANNVANQYSTSTLKDGEQVDTPFLPQDVVDLSQEAGGVVTSYKPKEPATQGVYDPTHADANAETGVVEYPNVDIAEERVAQIEASQAYAANLRSIKAYDEMMSGLLSTSA